MPLPSRNIELKARVSSLADLEPIARRMAGERHEVKEQLDTYFVVPHGRLKLREIDGRTAQLIAYSRADAASARPSDYVLVPIADAEGLKQALGASLGVRAAVRKRRKIYFYRNVRIHLDEVDGLGTFLEFEAVLDEHNDAAAGHTLLAELTRQFGLAAKDRVESSYVDLVERASGAAE